MAKLGARPSGAPTRLGLIFPTAPHVYNENMVHEVGILRV